MGFVSVEIRHVDVLPSSWEIEVVYGRPLGTSTGFTRFSVMRRGGGVSAVSSLLDKE